MAAKRSARIAALGYYGFGNLGDEAVLAGIRRALTDEFGSHEMLVLSANPDETRRLHPGVSAVERWKWRSAAARLRGTDIFILGGGSLLQDATSVQSVLWYALMALLARRLSRKMVWWGQGVGPLNSPVSRRIVRLIANQADVITVRDQDSAALLKAIGVSGSIHEVADPAFALQPISLPHFPDAKTSRLDSRVLLALRAWKSDAIGDILRSGDLGAAAGLTTSRHSVVESLPMHLPGDAEYFATLSGAKNVAMLNWRAEGWTPENVLAIVEQSRLVVAMRLHALIFAARCAVPFVALSYDPKVDALASAAGQMDALISVDGITSAALSSAIAKVMDTATERRAQLGDFAVTQRERARIPALICRDLM